MVFTPAAFAGSTTEQQETTLAANVKDSGGSSPSSAEGRLLVELEAERAHATAEAANTAQQPAAAQPKQEGTFRTQKFLEGVELDLDFNYRFMANQWTDILALGRTDFQPAPAGYTQEQLHEYGHTSFFNHRSSFAFRVVRPQRWNANLEMDLLGSDFNDGALLGAEPTGTLGAAGMRQASIKVRRIWIEYNRWVRVQVGRLAMRFGNGILANINRDGVRVFKNLNPRVQLVGVWFRGSQGSTIGESGDVNVDDKGGVQVVVNPLGGSNDALNAVIVMMNYQPVTNHRVQLAYVIKQWEGTFDERQPEKVFVDLNGGGTVRRLFTYAWEAAYQGGKSPRSPIVGTRLRNEAFLLFGTGSYRLPDDVAGGRLTFGVTGGFGTGDDNPRDGRQKSIQTLFVDETGYEYTVIYSDDILGYNGSAASLNNTQGFANTKFVQPSVLVQAHRDLSARITYTFLRAHKAQLEGTGPLGNGRFGVDPFLVFPATSTVKTQEIGHEIDLHVNYVVDKNVSLFTRVGRFVPGAIFGTGTHNVYKVESGLEFRF